jgi:Ca2+-binding RTX toxin-like protein
MDRAGAADDSQIDHVRDGAMSVRFIFSGLAVLTGLVMLAAFPVVAQGHVPAAPGSHPCTMTGTSGNDYLVGSMGGDVICGYGGDDIISGSGGNDTLKGGSGNDTIQGDAGRDVLYGGGGSDYLWIRDNAHDHGYGGKGYDRSRRDPFKDKLGSVEYHN